MNIHPDFADIIAALNDNGVEYVIVGSFALALLGRPRYTGDIDIWIRPIGSNARSTLKALADFGFGALGITEADILSGKIIQLGHPPVRVDLLTCLDGLSSEEIWAGRQNGKLGDHPVSFLGKDAFIKNKRAAGRHKDLADIEALGESPS